MQKGGCAGGGAAGERRLRFRLPLPGGHLPPAKAGDPVVSLTASVILS